MPLVIPSSAVDLYLPPGWDSHWRAAKAASGSAAANVAVLTDSFGIWYASDYINKPWPALLRAGWMAAGYPWGGDYWPVIYSQDWMNGSNPPAFRGTPPWVIGTPAGVTKAYYPDLAINPSVGWNSGLTGAQTGFATFTAPYACTALDIITYDYAASNFGYQVDGGATQTVNTTNAKGYGLRKTSVTGLGSAAHSVAFLNVAADFALMLQGIATYQNPGRGINMARWTRVGAAAAEWGFTTGAPADKVLLLQGKTNAAYNGFGFPTQPDLAIIGYGLNDAHNAYGIEGYRYAHRRLLQALRRGTPGCSVLFVVDWYNDPYSDEGGDNFSGNYSAMIRSLYGLAQEYGCAVANFQQRWAENPITTGYIDAGTGHPTDAGHADMAALIGAIV